jgi:hypothetical protein
LYWKLTRQYGEKLSTLIKIKSATEGQASSDTISEPLGHLRSAFDDLYCIMFEHFEHHWTGWIAAGRPVSAADADRMKLGTDAPSVLYFSLVFDQVKAKVEQILLEEQPEHIVGVLLQTTDGRTKVE